MGELRWRVGVDRETCIGSGICAATAPNHFTLDADRSRPLAELVEPDDVVIDAAESCPVEAIAVSDASTGERLAPEE
ncbi:ferredoxin [Gandjariella thermophila]|uniref:Ferredoxin n=1 Tax=Gandjariella thermophila TaxID=1931992 RepID=A0A4D4J4L1_9PSEU|nr:ferredoxin [Gandjariella thermophila]GDY31461.1 ferredoxin [Gandjariella thermophila]